VKVTYHEAAITSALPSSFTSMAVNLSSGRRLAVARQRVGADMELSPVELDAIMGGDEGAIPGEIRPYERIEAGLAEYF
jgi:hypothetical protein